MAVETSGSSGSDFEPDMGALSAENIRRMLSAGEAIRECYHVLREAGLNIVGEVLRGQGEFVELNHYPDRDVFEDRGLDIASQMPISVDGQIARLRALPSLDFENR